MAKIDLMSKYPKTNRSEISKQRIKVTQEHRIAAQKFDWLYFDGPREFGYGGYNYNPRFFKGVVEDFINHYSLKEGDSVLDVGCGKGFMLYDFLQAIPTLEVRGLDVSEYCYDNALPEIKPYFDIGSCDQLPYQDGAFDIVISIATIHNLDIEGVKRSIIEINRVARRGAFIKVNGFRNSKEQRQLEEWNLVAKTILSERDWENLFIETGYTYDYDFFRP